ncbi:SusC/RagA family TonB-linked outer membrane protein, partial [Pedobacter sp.]|uniref:SusC/RagA family TonB-linked outer membrane protein n=1 Tax=Pedobacter sp. TaxID=1411316 RepID=UPI003D7F299B
QKNLKGRVLDEKNQPLPGAGVKLKLSGKSTVTGQDGSFSITAADNENTLVISFIGYASKEVTIKGGNTVQTIVMSTGANELNDVVVVGYGSVKKSDVTGSVVSISEATLKEVPAPNLIAQLKGRTAGVTVVSNGSTPGTGGSIRIRGNRTITNSQGSSDALDGPLLVIDGMPYGGSINDFSPDDVASMDILKDASATAIYGSRGAGGVILITTKRGRTGKAVITYDAYLGVSRVLDQYNVYDGPGYAQFKLDAATYNRTSPGTTSYLLTQAEQAALDAGVSTNWQDLIYKNGYTNQHQLSISGGSDKTQFGMSGGYYKESGIIPHQDFTRGTLRTTIDHRINNAIKVGLNSINTISYNNTPGGGGVPSGLVKLTPLASPYNADGTLNLNPSVGSIDAAGINPLTLITKSDAILARTRRFRTFNSLYGEAQLFEGLKYRLNVGLDFRQENGNGYNGPLTYTNTNPSQASSNATINNSESWSTNIQNLLYYDKTFAEKHKLSVTALFELQKDHNKSSGFTVTGVPADYVLNSNFGLASAAPVSNPDVTGFSELGLISYMGRLNYSYDSRYLVTATLRQDGSSTLSPGHQYFTYPAIGLGWNISNEAFMKSANFISNLKLRGGWGVSGNRNVGAYATLGGLSASAYNFGQTTSGQQLAYLVTTLPNSDLGWQSTSQWDIGLDFGLFNNRITGSIDTYDQKTKDILLSVNLPYSNGAGSTFQNLGKTRGRGLEVSLTTNNIVSETGFNWSMDMNFFLNREEITQLTTKEEKSNVSNGWFVGQPLTVIYDVKKLGIWQTADATSGALAGQTSPVQFAGQIKVEDFNKDGKIDASDRQVIGNFQPKWEGGITNRFSYKAFDLSVVVFARIGMKVLVPYLSADGGANGFSFFNQGRSNQIKTDYWTTSNPTNDFPAPDAGTDRLNFGSTLAYQDGSFVKIRSINFGYTLPSSLLSKVNV